jgi:hypothetical protein
MRSSSKSSVWEAKGPVTFVIFSPPRAPAQLQIMKKKSVLVFPDPEASFFCYMRKQTALRKHAAGQIARLEQESLKARLDFAAPQNSGAPSMLEKQGPRARTCAQMRSADEIK